MRTMLLKAVLIAIVLVVYAAVAVPGCNDTLNLSSMEAEVVFYGKVQDMRNGFEHLTGGYALILRAQDGTCLIRYPVLPDLNLSAGEKVTLEYLDNAGRKRIFGYPKPKS